MDQARTSFPEQRLVDVPESAVVDCPLVHYDLRPVSACPACPKFGGLEDRFPVSAGQKGYPFHQRYIVLCFGAPVKRQVHALAGG